MKLSRQEEVALLLASELTRHNGIFISLSEIGSTHGISLAFLKKIARMLKKKGILVSKEGQNGGYALGKSPQEISAWDVMDAVSARTGTFGKPRGSFKCPLQPGCMPQAIRQLISEAFMRYASDVTIDQFLNFKKIQ